jgi:hypothetical protein
MLHCREDLRSVSLEWSVPVNDLVLALVELEEALYALEVIVPVLLVRQEIIHRPETRSYSICYIYTAMKIPFTYSFSGNCVGSVSIFTFMCL